jgi:hypothetical protein
MTMMISEPLAICMFVAVTGTAAGIVRVLGATVVELSVILGGA